MHYLLFNHESFAAVMSIRSCGVRVSTMGSVMVVFVIFSKQIFTNRVYLDLLIVCVPKRYERVYRYRKRVVSDVGLARTEIFALLHFFFSSVERSLYMSSPHRPRNSSSLSVWERERERENERGSLVYVCNDKHI